MLGEGNGSDDQDCIVLCEGEAYRGLRHCCVDVALVTAREKQKRRKPGENRANKGNQKFCWREIGDSLDGGSEFVIMRGS